MTADGDVKLADFGVSSVLKKPNAAAGAGAAGKAAGAEAKAGAAAEPEGELEFAGSPLWMAPEVCDQKMSSYAVDIWALGITAIEIAESKIPYCDWTVLTHSRLQHTNLHSHLLICPSTLCCAVLCCAESAAYHARNHQKPAAHSAAEQLVR